MDNPKSEAVDWNGIPKPEDDGAAEHLTGATIPQIVLASTNGTLVDLSSLVGLTVVYAYPLTRSPNIELPKNWKLIPGATGCTPQSLGFRRDFERINELGVRSVYGLSTQSSEFQQEAATRLELPFSLLSDETLLLANSLRLPTFSVDGKVLLKRMTMVIQRGLIIKVFYPVFPPDANSYEVIRWLETRRNR